MRRRRLIMIIMLLCCLRIWAQHVATVGGVVTDAATGSPLAGVSVSDGQESVVTNDDGRFVLKSGTTPDAVSVSHVGYRSQRISIGPSATTLHIRLQPMAIELREVLVTAPGNARELVEAAMRMIPQNYSQEPELYHCFYRETAMKRQHYIMVAEGVVDMYKTAYGHNGGRDRVAIRKGRRLLSPRSSDTLSVKVTGGPVAPLQLDVAKNLDFLLNKEELDCYELTMGEPTTANGRLQYVVVLEPLREMPWALYHGRLYIDRQTLAFTRVELSLDMSSRDKATRAMLVRKPAGVRFRPREMSLLVDYRQDAGGKTRISYVRTTFRFNCDWRRRLFATSFTAVCEMAVTSSTDRDVQPIRGRESFDQRDAFYDKVDFFRDPDFWSDYNIIEPTERLDRAIDHLLKVKREK